MTRLFPVLLLTALDASTAPVDLAPLDTEKHKAALLVFITHDCPVANRYAPEIARITKQFAKQVKTTLVYVDPDMTEREMVSHRKDYGYAQIPVVHDRKHALVHASGARVTPEAVIVLPGGKVAYRGRISDFYTGFGVARRVVTQHDLRDALAAVISGQRARPPRGKTIGCFIPKLANKK